MDQRGITPTAEHPPGTTLLISKNATQETGRESALKKNSKNVVLRPQPSSDPDDPLNWSRLRKGVSLFSTLFWCTTMQCVIAWMGPAYGYWNQELGISYASLNNGMGILVFLCGVGIAFVQPWALKYGRRGPYALSSVIVLAGLGLGMQMDRGVAFYYAYCALAGLGSSPSFSVTETSLLDVTFLHQRGAAMGLYALSFSVGSFLTPVAAGYVLALQDWRWCFRYLLILFGTASVVMFLAGEETLFDRGALVGRHPTAEDRGDEHPETVLNRVDDDAKKAVSTKDLEQTRSVASGAADVPSLRGATPEKPLLSRYLASMALYRRDASVQAPLFPTLIWRPLCVLQLPAVLFAGIMISLCGFWVSLVIVTQAPVFSAPPYNFGPSTLGLMYLALVVGTVAGSVWGGPFADHLVLKLARRRSGDGGGISEAEDRLWAYIPVPAAAAGGVALWGASGASAIGTHWAAPSGALVLVGFAISSAITVSMGYALDCYPDLSGQTIQATNVLRNLVAGALTFAIPSWVDRQGFPGACATIAAVGFVANGVFVLFLVAGKRIRWGTMGLYIRLAQG